MNRDIKFRGKIIDNGEWVTGCLIIENPPLQCFPSEKEENKYLIGKSGFADWNMPRSGLLDKAGKEIYEGDILKMYYSRDMSGKEIVVFSEVVEFQLNEGAGTSGFDISFLQTSEIIGNVSDNPELLK